jgi:hypothetical protein
LLTLTIFVEISRIVFKALKSNELFLSCIVFISFFFFFFCLKPSELNDMFSFVKHSFFFLIFSALTLYSGLCCVWRILAVEPALNYPIFPSLLDIEIDSTFVAKNKPLLFTCICNVLVTRGLTSLPLNCSVWFAFRSKWNYSYSPV